MLTTLELVAILDDTYKRQEVATGTTWSHYKGATLMLETLIRLSQERETSK